MALNQSQIDLFNRTLQNQVANINSNNDPDAPQVTTSNAPPTAVVYAMETSQMSPSDYAQMAGVDPSTSQQMYEQYNPTGQYSTQTIPGTQTTWASINQVPGMYDYVMQKSSVDSGNDDGGTVFDPSKAAQAVATGMQDPNSIAKDYLTTQAQLATMGHGVNTQANFENAVTYLAQNGVSPNDIQSLAQAGVNNGINTVNYMNANSGGLGGFLGKTLDAVASQIASPEGIASLIANSFYPGAGAFVKTIADAAGGKQNLTSDLVGMAMTQSGTSVPGSSSVTGALSNYVPSSVAQDMTAGALATAANLAQGKSLEDSLSSGIATGVNVGLNNAVSANSPYAITKGPAPVTTIDTSQLPSALNDIPPTPTNAPLSDTYALSGTSDGLGLKASSTDGLTAPDSPNLTAMGGGQGLTVDTSGGVLSQMGVTPPNSQVVMGDPNSFINDPSVTGVAQQTTDQLSKLDKSGNNVITTTADPETGQVSTTITPATLPNNPLADSTVGTSTSTGGKSTTSGSTTSGGSSLPSSGSGTQTTQGGLSALNSAPSMLAGAPVYGTKSNIEQPLTQIYSSITPGEQSTSQHSSTPTPQSQSDIANQLTPELVQQLINQSTKFVASGGSIDDQMMVKPINTTPRMLAAAPTNEYYSSMGQKPNSRINPLKSLYGGIGARPTTPFMAKGGLPSKYEEAAPEGHKPEFITGLTGYYAQGGGTGQSDDIPAMLHQGDYVMDADTVAALGDGSSKAGAHTLEKLRTEIPHHTHDHGEPVPAQIADGEYVFPASFVSSLGGGDNKRGAELLDKMREELRKHKRSAPKNKIPPKAKSPLSYLRSVKG